jgi:putative aldouronate transport system substrate-binding protein
MFKRTLKIVLTALLAAGLSAAAFAQGGSDGTAAAAGGKTKTFTLFMGIRSNQYYSDYSKNPAFAYFQKMTGLHFDVQSPVSGQEGNAMSIMMGTGEYTDLMSLGGLYTGSLQDLLDQGITIDIAKYLQYMPNYKKMMDNDPVFKKWQYNDNGQILGLPIGAGIDPKTPNGLSWAGFMYQRDLLKAELGHDPQFPSGNAVPTTIADWDYMLPIFQKYYKDHNISDGYALIIPYNAYYYFGELMTTFGAGAMNMVRNNKIENGYLQPGFRKYIEKLHEWYSKGYIYTDFASRVNDYAQFPDPSLVYNGKIGVWYGVTSSLGDRMDTDTLKFNVQPLPNPIDAKDGITAAPAFVMRTGPDEVGPGLFVASTCKDIPTLLSAWDKLFTEEGAMLYMGITKAQGADTDPVMLKAGLQDGTYTMNADGTVTFNKLLSIANKGGRLDFTTFGENLIFPVHEYKYTNAAAPAIEQKANAMWTKYPMTDAWKMMSGNFTYTAADEKTMADNGARMKDITDTQLAKWIMGTDPINDATWNKFVKDMNDAGAAENCQILQKSWNTWMSR